MKLYVVCICFDGDLRLGFDLLFGQKVVFFCCVFMFFHACSDLNQHQGISL